jgi:hypothetical protein
MPMNPRLLVPRATFDPDAAAYLRAVEAADGQALETPVKRAVDDFIKGCKADGIWDAIKACCLLCGPRTLAGALVPLRGDAPTAYGGWASGDYDRSTGLTGNGTSLYLDANRVSADEAQNDRHISVYATSAASNNEAWIGSIDRTASPASANQIFWRLTPQHFLINASSLNATATDVYSGSETLVAVSRNSSDTQTARAMGIDYEDSIDSVVPSSLEQYVFARNDTDSTPDYSDATFAFYSFGSHISDLAALESHISAYVTAIGAAV